MNKIIVCDLDEVLANQSHREHFAKAKDWDAYFNLCNMDKAISSTYVSIVKALSKSFEVKILTGRNESCRVKTFLWIKENFPSLNITELIMRPENDRTNQADFKNKELKKLKKEYDIVLFVDDNEQNCMRSILLGIPTLFTGKNKK